MILKIYTDVHLFSPMHDGTVIKPEGAYLIGDNVDMTNCHKKDIQKALKTRASLQERALGYIDGNHEAYSKGNNHIWVRGYTYMMVHGDFEAWGAKRATKYRNKSHGAGWIKRQIWVRLLKFFESIWPVKPSKKMINNMVALAEKKGATVIIAGHKHPRKTYNKVHKNIRIIVLKRGYNEVHL